MLAQTGSRFDDVIKQIPNVNHFPPLMTQQEIIEEVRNFKDCQRRIKNDC